MGKKSTCIFCDRDNSDIHTIIAENSLAYARWDNYPAADGHAEILPKRHVKSVLDLTDEEANAMKQLRTTVRDAIKARWCSEHGDTYGDDLTIGYNDGRLAGRTVDHVHEHMIPRKEGDSDDPVGGIRHVIRGKGNYTTG